MPPEESAKLSRAVLKRCDRLGFTAPHIVDLESYGTEAGQGLREYLAKHHHGTMAWLSETEERRSAIRLRYPFMPAIEITTTSLKAA